MNAEIQLSSLLPEGEYTYDKIFGLVTRSKPPIFLGLTFMVLFSLQFVFEIPANFKVFCDHPVNLIFLGVAYPFWFVTFTTFVWMYFCSIRGLHELGKKLLLRSFHEDKMLGVRPIGSLSLALTSTYFTGLCILALLPTVLSPDTPTLGYVFVLSSFILLGVVFFFLPLYTIHKKMLEVKVKQQELLRSELYKAVKSTSDSKIEDHESMSDIKDALSRLTTVLKVEVTKDEVMAMPTWPIDMPILSRLLAMAVSIALVIIAEFILKRVLHI